MGGCQNYGPFLGTLNIRGRIIIGTQKGTIILITSHVQLDLDATPDDALVGPGRLAPMPCGGKQKAWQHSILQNHNQLCKWQVFAGMTGVQMVKKCKHSRKSFAVAPRLVSGVS